MSAQKVYEATKEDGKELLRVLESSSAKGAIELLYTRRPDAFTSYIKESKDSKVYAVKDDSGRIVGTVGEIIKEAYINGEIKKVAYIGGLKKDADYKGKVNWGKIFIENLVLDDIDCYYCSIIKDNINAQKMFEKIRSNTVKFNFITEYTTFLQKAKFMIKGVNSNNLFKQAENEDESKIIQFLNEYGRKKDLFPVISKLSDLTNLKIENFYYLEENEKIIALGALWNQTEYRQYIVKKYNGILKFARLLNPLIYAIGYMKLPKENIVFDFPMLSFLIAVDDNENYYKEFLNNISKEVSKKYDFFAYGTKKSSITHSIFKNIKNIGFDSKIYTIDFVIKKKKSEKVRTENVWLECGML